MERLTTKVDNLYQTNDKFTPLLGIKRLGEYEDTGLTPEEIENLKDQSASDVAEVVHGKNITAMHPVDEFLCSVCGFCCSDYTQTRYDENGDYEYSCECEFSYCPNCGAKMDGGKGDE